MVVHLHEQCVPRARDTVRLMLAAGPLSDNTKQGWSPALLRQSL
jgi:hypothetical protein